MPSIAFTVSLAILWCPLRLLSAYSANLYAADGGYHGLHGIYAKRRFQHKPSPSLEGASFSLLRSFLPLSVGL